MCDFLINFSGLWQSLIRQTAGVIRQTARNTARVQIAFIWLVNSLSAWASEVGDSHCQRGRERGSRQQDRQSSHVQGAKIYGHWRPSTCEIASRHGLSLSICQSHASDIGTLLLTKILLHFVFCILPLIRGHRGVTGHRVVRPPSPPLLYDSSYIVFVVFMIEK